MKKPITDITPKVSQWFDQLMITCIQDGTPLYTFMTAAMVATIAICSGETSHMGFKLTDAEREEFVNIGLEINREAKVVIDRNLNKGLS